MKKEVLRLPLRSGSFDVTVINREEITTYPKIATPVQSILVTYVAAGLPPKTLTIIKTDYTERNEKKLIRDDIEQRLKHKPESFTV